MLKINNILGLTFDVKNITPECSDQLYADILHKVDENIKTDGVLSHKWVEISKRKKLWHKQRINMNENTNRFILFI